MEKKHSAIGKQIMELRKELGLSQDKLAEMSGVHTRTIAALELGDALPRYEILAKLSEFFEPLLGYKPFPFDLGARLKTMREDLGLTRPQVAKDIKYHSGAELALIEEGQRYLSFSALERLVDFADENFVDLFGPEDPTKIEVNRSTRESKPTNLGARIQELRKELGLKQRELAQMLGLSISTIRFYEMNRLAPSYLVLVQLSKIFEERVGYQAVKGDFNTRLRTMRKGLGLGQNDISRKLGKSSSYVGMLETQGGSPTLKSLETIIDFADKHYIDFFGRENPSVFYQWSIGESSNNKKEQDN